jgi:hypothetical protein
MLRVQNDEHAILVSMQNNSILSQIWKDILDDVCESVLLSLENDFLGKIRDDHDFLVTISHQEFLNVLFYNSIVALRAHYALKHEEGVHDRGDRGFLPG